MSKKQKTLGDNLRSMEAMYPYMDVATRIKFRCVKEMAEPDYYTPDPRDLLYYDISERINEMWARYQELSAFFADAQAAVFDELHIEHVERKQQTPATYLDLVE